MLDVAVIGGIARDRLLFRNDISSQFFEEEALRIAAISRRMAERFQDGGRLLAFGRGACATDAQHVAVGFVHPMVPGKRILPALDLSPFIDDGYDIIEQTRDIVIGFGPPGADPVIEALLDRAHRAGALTLALPGKVGDYAVISPSDDPFVHQEMIEILYHNLWESVHVFLDGYDENGHEVERLYPHLAGGSRQQTIAAVEEVAARIEKRAREDSALRMRVAEESADVMADVAAVVYQRLALGGKIIAMGNGGSATHANDLAFDCTAPPREMTPVPAISLSGEPALITALANDMGARSIFLRQLDVHLSPKDVLFALSTSGNSPNIVTALKRAKGHGAATVALLGSDGGEVVREKLADFVIQVPSLQPACIHELHASVYHVVRELLDEIRHNP